MTDFNMLFAGFGGQGILFQAKVAAYAGLLDGREVSWLPSYGPEMRGGTANCCVCLSDNPISSPLITKPDVLVVMNLPSYHKFIDSALPGASVFIDSSLIDEKTARSDVNAYYFPATSLAEKQGLLGLANIVMLGAVYEKIKFCRKESLIEGIKNSVPSHRKALLSSNLKAVALAKEFNLL